MSTSSELRLICKQCAVQHIHTEEEGVVVYVDVPVSAGHSEFAFTATLRCNISRNHHDIALISTKDHHDKHLFLDDELLDNLVARINQVEAKQPCGTAGVCPSEVTEAAIKASAKNDS